MKTDFLDLQNKIRGPVFSVLTPFDPITEDIDYESLEKYIQNIYDAGGNVFYVMAYNSRYSQLTFEEIKELNAFVARKVKELSSQNIVIVADPPHCSTKVSIEFAQHAERIGADMISLIVRERFYFEDQIFKHFEMINNHCNIGILIHEMPFLNGLGGPPVNWPLTLLDRVANLGNVIAIKEDAKDDNYSKDAISLLKDRLSIIISGGGKSQWLRFTDLGCQAWLNGIGVFEPKIATTFWNSWNNNQKIICDRIVKEIEEPFFEHGVKKYGWHLAIKVALEHFNVMSRHDRMPLMPLNEVDSNLFKQKLENLPIRELIETI
jgi:dihydrodipicolinate synthase/N-acetylneuraminate lyase